MAYDKDPGKPDIKEVVMQTTTLFRKLLVIVLALWVGGFAMAAGQTEPAATRSDVGFNEIGFPIVDEPITLSLFGIRQANRPQWEELSFFHAMEEKTNISFTYETPIGTAYRERKSILFASGMIPDLFFGVDFTEGDITQFSSQGALLPLNDLLDRYMVELQGHMESNEEIRRAITTADGNIYALPRIIEIPFDVTEKTWIRTEWLDTLGLSMPTTLDEFYDVLVAFRDGDPNQDGQRDEIPLTSAGIGRLRHAMLAPFGILWLSGFPMLDADAGGTLSYIPAMDEFREYLTFMNRLYREELLDNNIFTNTDPELAAIGREQRLGVYPHAAPFLYNEYDNNELYSALSPLARRAGEPRIWPRHNGVQNGRAVLSSTNPHPEATVRWLDYLYSVEGSQLVDQGPEGFSWQWVDATRDRWVQNSVESRAEGTPGVAGMTPGIRLSYWISRLDVPHALHLYRETTANYVPYWEFMVPRMVLSDADQRRVTAILADMDPYVEQIEARFITGEEPLTDARWQAHLRVLEQMGIRDLVRIYQQAYTAYHR
ncbi:MAG: extracellular solute-binding protein [Spirochaetaceae bacterium]|nr:MAG: extracellular solute-binding protein [Spirochaetaceae bacterium]